MCRIESDERAYYLGEMGMPDLDWELYKKNSRDRFTEYAKNYDLDDPKIYLKYAHTFRVADLCEKIARSIELSPEDCFIAYMSGLLHDIGRFEQVRRYNTFVDAESIDHAHLSFEILFDDTCGIMREFIDVTDYDYLIGKAVYNHSAYRIEEGLDERCLMFCNILRDADKVDIYRVNCDTPLEEIYNTTTEELFSCEVTKEVFEAFMEHHAVLKALKKTPIDNVVGHAALYFELIYDFSKDEALRQGYLPKLCNFKSNNEETNIIFAKIRKELGINEF